MELTLTGASLIGDKKAKVVTFAEPGTVGSSHGTSSDSTSTTAATATSSDTEISRNKTWHAHDHSHNHSHSNHDKCCNHAPVSRANFTSVESIPEEKLIQNKPMLFSAMIASIKGGSFSTFKYLVDIILKYEKQKGEDFFSEWGTDINGCKSCLGRRLEDGHTLIHWCAKRGDDVRFIEYLAEKVPDIDMHAASADNVGMAPLHWACTEGSIPICNFLLKQVEKYKGLNSIDPMQIRDKAGCTPLLIASQYGHADLVAFFIKRGADASSLDTSQDTALHWAAYKGSVPVCGLLLHLNGIKDHLDVKDSFGQTPLHLAALRGNLDVVEYIMEQAEAYAELSGSTYVQEYGDEEYGAIQEENEFFPAKLLQMEDKNGKTPLDLAVKKQKVHCELLLRDYMEKHCNPNQGLTGKIISALKPFFSCRSWLSWMGFIPETSGRPPRFIFWFVVANLALASLYEMTIYVPIFGSIEKGRLWDHMTLHIATIFGFFLTWISLIFVHKIDPGLLAMKYTANAGVDTASFSCFNENKRVKREMHSLTNELRNSYEDTLESFVETSKNGIENIENLGLCHSCHIVRPHRSKHCRVMNRCILLFDHHCPFVGTTVGLYNYKYFYLFVLSFTITEILFTVTGFLHIHHGPGKEYGKILIAIYFSIYTLLTGSLSIYHTQLIRENLTTNEHQNRFKKSYAYLLSNDGRNPFNKGFLQNLYSRIYPSKESYILEKREDKELERVRKSISGKKNDEEKNDLISNIV